jgi:dolichyl-phosphate-mannose--protein O-mannosyl transferase
MYLLDFFCILLLTCLMSCGSNGSKQFKVQADNVLHEGQINNDTIISSYKFYLSSSMAEVKKQSWVSIVMDTVNDEFNKWIEVKLYYSNNEWIKLETGDTKKAPIISFETNSNYFLNDSPIKIGDEVSILILKDSVQFNFDEGKAGFSIGSYEIRGKCLDYVDDLEYDKILEAREKKKKELLPDKIKNCKVSSIRVLNI